MTESKPTPGSVPAQPAPAPPLRKRVPVFWVLAAIVVLIGFANLSNLVTGKGKSAPKSSFYTQPSTISPQQVKSYQATQANQARHDAELQQQQRQQAAVLGQSQQLPSYQEAEVPGPEADTAAPMTAAQRQMIYGDSPNAPQRTSDASQGQAEAKQRELARKKQRQDALNSDTVAIDFSQQGSDAKAATGVLGGNQQGSSSATGEELGGGPSASARHPAVEQVSVERPDQHKVDPAAKADPLGAYPFDSFQGQLYRVFEGTVLEGVVTNHIDGGFNGPILVMLTTDYYSHDHQQLLMPQGTRLIGTVQNVGSQGQRKLLVTFHRAVCPDGFSLDLDRYVGLDPIGTTGLASKVDNHYLSSFAAAAVIGGLGGLAQIGDSGSLLTPSTEIRNGISQESAQETEQILNHFLNRLPTITLKEGSRARVYIGRDILIPSYAEHRVDPTL